MNQSDSAYVHSCDAWIKTQEFAIQSSENRISHLEKGIAIDIKMLEAEKEELHHKHLTMEEVKKNRQEVIDRNK